MSNYVDGVSFSTEICCRCAMAFAMPSDYQRRRKNDHAPFYCPNGHQQHYTGPDETSKLKSELERQSQILEVERQRSARLQAEHADVKRAHTRMRERVFNGVCPCCNRTFQDLMRHMHTEHAAERSLRVWREAFGLSQAMLAKEIGISPVYVSMHETGKAAPEYAKKAIDDWLASKTRKEGAT